MGVESQNRVRFGLDQGLRGWMDGWMDGWMGGPRCMSSTPQNTTDPHPTQTDLWEVEDHVPEALLDIAKEEVGAGGGQLPDGRLAAAREGHCVLYLVMEGRKEEGDERATGLDAPPAVVRVIRVRVVGWG